MRIFVAPNPTNMEAMKIGNANIKERFRQLMILLIVIVIGIVVTRLLRG